MKKMQAGLLMIVMAFTLAGCAGSAKEEVEEWDGNWDVTKEELRSGSYMVVGLEVNPDRVTDAEEFEEFVDFATNYGNSESYADKGDYVWNAYESLMLRVEDSETGDVIGWYKVSNSEKGQTATGLKPHSKSYEAFDKAWGSGLDRTLEDVTE